MTPSIPVKSMPAMDSDTFPPLHALLPHAATMLLLNRLVAVDEDSAWAEIDITPASLFHDGTGVGCWIGIEYMAQTIAAYAGYHARQRGDTARIGFLLGTRRYECRTAQFTTGSTLLVTAHQLPHSGHVLGAFACTIEDKQTRETLAEATVTVFQPDNAQEFTREKQA